VTTLLQDLETAATAADCPAYCGRTDCALANTARRLRAHAACLREEMERANTRWTGSTSIVVRALLERINGGPAKP